nr:MCE family protein [Thermoleophilaceae bacterium]
MLLFAAIAVAAVVVVAAFLLLRSDGRYEVTAVFDQAFGLVPGGEVKAAGVLVGEIEEIELGEDGLPRIRMAIDDAYRLNRGATAELRLFSLVGQLNRYVGLQQGNGPELQDGATITAARTSRPIEFDELLELFPPKTRTDIGQVLGRLERGTRGRGPDLARTLRHSANSFAQTALLFDDVSADGDALRALVIDGRSVVEALAADPNELGGMVDRLAPVLDAAAARQGDLSAGLELLPSSLASARSALGKLDSEIGDLRDLTASARPAVGQLVPASRRLRPVIAEARPALD